MTKNVWAHYGHRVKYIRTLRFDPDEMVYFCLDGKFHSWAIDKETVSGGRRWHIQTLENPDRVDEFKSIHTWLAWITKDGT